MKILSLAVFFVVSLIVIAGPTHEALAGPCNPNVTTC
jgi:hypothetical protein